MSKQSLKNVGCDEAASACEEYTSHFYFQVDLFDYTNGTISKRIFQLQVVLLKYFERPCSLYTRRRRRRRRRLGISVSPTSRHFIRPSLTFTGRERRYDVNLLRNCGV
jgi:hypothetical protein